MKLTIIIPCLNAAEFLAQAVSSVDVPEADGEVEVIVVDNGSTDETVAIANGVPTRHVSVTVSEFTEEIGPGSARNHGVRQARGDWIVFLDADDAYREDGIARLLRAIDGAGPEVDIVAFDWTYRGSEVKGQRQDLDVLASGDREAIVRAYLANEIDSSAIFGAFRKAALEENQIWFRSGLHEDVDFMFAAYQKARSILCLSDILYAKDNRPSSIVNTLSRAHLLGYFNGAAEIFRLLDAGPEIAHKKGLYADFVADVAGSRIGRYFRANVQNQIDFRDFSKTLVESLQIALEPAGAQPADLDGLVTSDWPKWRRLVSAFLEHLPRDDSKEAWADFERTMQAEMQKTWSCYDLHNSVFLAPDEVRTCCKRYFQDGKLKGDAVLFSEETFRGEHLDHAAIRDEKKRIQWRINRGAEEQCDGCPHLKYQDWGEVLDHGVKYLSLEYHSLCNMRCNYCSEKYWGGEKPFYDIVETVQSLIDNGQLDETEYLVWGGGEPTFEKNFDQLIEMITAVKSTVRQRVITNATIFKESLAELLRQDKAFIVVSIDAGNAETFERVRGTKRFRDVMENLQRYAACRPENVIVKYILQEDNSSIEELTGFCELVSKYDLRECNFQISCNFKTESVVETILTSICALHSKLLDLGTRFVFWDDLVWQRMSAFDPNTVSKLRDDLESAGVEFSLATPERYPEVILWGTGAQADMLMTKSHFLSNVRVSKVLDPRKDVIGTEFHGHVVSAPDAVMETDLPIVIGAVQSAPFIYTDLMKLQVPKSRIIADPIL